MKNSKELRELGARIDRLMIEIEAKEFGTYSLNDSSQDEIELLYILENMISWQHKVNKGIDITNTLGSTLLLSLYDIKKKRRSFEDFKIFDAEE